MLSFNFATTVEIDVLVEGNGDLGYEPFPTQNHDDPRFSDPGSPTEIDEVKVFLNKIDITDQLDDNTLEEIKNEAIEVLEQERDNRFGEEYREDD